MIQWLKRLFKRKNIQVGMDIGDYVIHKTSHLCEYFQNGPRKIKFIREVKGPEGDAISVEGLDNIEFWSNYLKVIK